MGKNVIVSEETVRDLLEAHASLCAWYYQLWRALQASGATSAPPDDAARAAFVDRLVQDFPEVSHIARTIKSPRLFVPAPVTQRRPSNADEPATLVEPAPKRGRSRPDFAAVELEPPNEDPSVKKP